MALLFILPFIIACLKCYCRYKILSNLSKREESGRVSNANGNGTNREDSVGPIGAYHNGGFNGVPAGGYNLPSIEAQYPRQQYTNAINGEPPADYNLPPSYQENVGPIRGYNGGFNGEPAGGYNLPSVEVQYPPQQYTNALNEYTSRKYTGEPTGEPTRGPTEEPTGEPTGDYNLPPREAQYPERGQYFSTGQFFTKNQPESAV